LNNSVGNCTPTASHTLNLLANNQTLISLEKLEKQVKQKIHNRKFREYCNQIINKEIDQVCYMLLHEIVRFQDRMYHKNPIKAKSKRRYVMGIREVTKHLKLNKLKCVILAPNCEKIQSKGGLDDAINFIIETAMQKNVPFLFALGRKSLGKAVNKLVPISVVGIFDYAGAEEYFKQLVNLAKLVSQFFYHNIL
jgi:ribosomal protein L7Ae-like RNA K-turn-binding protein